MGTGTPVLCPHQVVPGNWTRSQKIIFFSTVHACTQRQYVSVEAKPSSARFEESMTGEEVWVQLAIQARTMGHGYIGHNQIGHNYMGHNYIGHNYIGSLGAARSPGMHNGP